jgi:hypothetical protein
MPEQNEAESSEPKDLSPDEIDDILKPLLGGIGKASITRLAKKYKNGDASNADMKAILDITPTYLIARTAIKQEQILAEQHEVLKSMKKQSDCMTCHSWAMIGLTIAIFALMIWNACK